MYLHYMQAIAWLMMHQEAFSLDLLAFATGLALNRRPVMLQKISSPIHACTIDTTVVAAPAPSPAYPRIELQTVLAVPSRPSEPIDIHHHPLANRHSSSPVVRSQLPSAPSYCSLNSALNAAAYTNHHRASPLSYPARLSTSLFHASTS